ncbi:hypothetical protein, partial [Botrimarina sp.]|uniref:hypothetical protein n=1 Tax=Botrimarina sp. TaxID=2795802 RepID=UPI0032EB1090
MSHEQQLQSDNDVQVLYALMSLMENSIDSMACCEAVITVLEKYISDCRGTDSRQAPTIVGLSVYILGALHPQMESDLRLRFESAMRLVLKGENPAALRATVFWLGRLGSSAAFAVPQLRNLLRITSRRISDLGFTHAGIAAAALMRIEPSCVSSNEGVRGLEEYEESLKSSIADIIEVDRKKYLFTALALLRPCLSGSSLGAWTPADPRRTARTASGSSERSRSFVRK